MDRRSFMAGLAGLPIVGLGARMFGLPKPTAKSGITVHGPELIEIIGYGFNKPRSILSLRFENVPWQEKAPLRVLIDRLQPLFVAVNRSHWRWPGGVERARTLMLTDIGMTPLENGLCSVVCAFTPALDRPCWPGSHRPVDFETEILKALEGKG